MWSGWPERVDVYIGTGTVLVKRRAHALVSLHPPATLPLGDVLAKVDDACERDRCRPWRLHVTLSASLCPPVVFAVPEGLKRWSEAMALAQAAAADAWGLPMDQAHELVCALDTGRHGLAAALMKGTQDRIQAWAGRHRGHLVSLEPLWAVATRARACRSSQVRRVTLHEPGALSIVPDAGGTGTADAESEGGIRVRFSPEVLPHRQQWPHGPAAWDGHWERLA